MMLWVANGRIDNVADNRFALRDVDIEGRWCLLAFRLRHKRHEPWAIDQNSYTPYGSVVRHVPHSIREGFLLVNDEVANGPVVVT